jgi:hypothetical protein
VKIDRLALEQARDAAQERRNEVMAALKSASPADAPSLQRELDRCIGFHDALEATYDQHCRFPVAPGTILHGLDVSKMDWRTRAMVMSRNLGTIYALGGRPDPE